MEGIREREKRRVPAGVAASMLSPEVRYAGDEDHVLHIHLSQLHEFKGHTFNVRKTSGDFEALVESAKVNGIKTPLIVRPYRDITGEYEIIAGHRRREAAKDAGLDKVPCIVLNLDDPTAEQLMGESNIQRPSWQPSERARTYKIWIAAEKRRTGIKAGRPDNCATELHNLSETQRPSNCATELHNLSETQQPDNCATELHNLEKGTKIRDRAAQRFGVSGQMIDIYVKLTNLVPDLLELVDYNYDNPKCGIQVKAGYQLAFLSEIQQNIVLSVLSDYPEYCLKEKEAKAIRQEAANANDQLSALDVEDVLGFRIDDTVVEEKPKKTNLSLPCDFGTKFKRHKNDPALIERLSRVISEYLEEVEE